MNWALIVLLLSVYGAVADVRSPVTSSTSTSTSITSDNSIAHDNGGGVTSNNIRLAASAVDNFDGDDTTQLLSLLGNDEGDRTHNDPTMKGSNDAEAADAHNTTPAGQIADGSDEGEIFSCAYRGPSPADPDYKRHSDPASMSSRGTVMPGRRRMLCNAPLSPPPSPHTRHNPSSPSRQDGPGYNEGDYEDGEGVRHSCFTMWTMVNGRQHITYQGCIGSQLEGHQSCTSHTCVATRQLWRRNTTTYYCCCATPLCNTHFSYQPASAGDGGGATMEAPPHDRHHLHTRDTASADLLVVVPLIVCCILLSLAACVGVLLLRRHHKHTTTNAGGGVGGGRGGVWRWWRVLVAKRLDAAASGGAASGGVEDPPPPFTPTVHFDQLNMGEMIGRGRYGSVYGAVLCGRDVAVKMFPAWYRNYYCTERHIYQLPWMEHAALLKYFGGNECRRDGVSHFFLVLARAQLGTLCEFLENHVLCVDQLYRMAYTTISGLAHLHTVIQRGGVTKPALAHRDFNSRNVLVRADGSCCVCDLGFAMQLGGGCGAGGDAAEGQREQHTDTVSLTDVGTLRYMAPEVLEGAVNLRECESALKQVDMYAAALVLWELTSRCADFYQITTSCDSGGGGGDDDGVQAQPPRYQLPYQQQVGCHPTFEQMQALVVEQRCRPALNDAWQRPGAPPPLRHICRTIEDTWDSDGEARLTALCLLERLTELPILWHRYQGSSSNVLNVARSPMSPPTTTSDVISDVTSALTSPILDERTCDTLLLSPEQQMNARNLQVSALHTHTSNQQQQQHQQQHFRPSLLRSSDNNNDSSAICAAVECQPLLAAPTVATSSGGGGHNVPSPPAL